MASHALLPLLISLFSLSFLPLPKTSQSLLFKTLSPENYSVFINVLSLVDLVVISTWLDGMPGPFLVSSISSLILLLFSIIGTSISLRVLFLVVFRISLTCVFSVLACGLGNSAHEDVLVGAG